MRFPSGVTFDHVVSHEGEEGNEEADRLARLAINLGVSIAKVSEERDDDGCKILLNSLAMISRTNQAPGLTK